MSRVLITGCAGFLGAHLLRRVVAAGSDQVFGIARPGGRASAVPGVQTLPADLTNRKQIEAAMERVRPDVVFHCAMSRGHAADAAARLEALATSVSGTAHLAEAALTSGVRRFVFAGSFLVYGRQEGTVRESAPLAPHSFRGAAKAGASLCLQQYAAHCGLGVVELRIFSVYGPGEAPQRFIPTLLRAARDAEPLPLIPDPRHDFVYISDVADACLLAAQADLPPGTIVNIGGGQSWRNDEVVEVASQVTGRKITCQPGAYAGSAADGGHGQADISEAARQLQWRPAHTLAEGLNATYQWLLQSTSA